MLVKYIVVYLLLQLSHWTNTKLRKKVKQNLFICMGKPIHRYHNKKIVDKFDFIDKWLPAHYTSSVNLILKENTQNPAYIRRVKNRRMIDPPIIDALYKVSLFNKIQVENEI